MGFNIKPTLHAQERIVQRLPHVPPDEVWGCIRERSVMVRTPRDLVRGWQRKDFLVFWLGNMPWVAVVDEASRICLSIFPAWDAEKNRSAALHLKSDSGEISKPFWVGKATIRQAILLSAEPIEFPEVFRSPTSSFLVTARVQFADGVIRVHRLGRVSFNDEVAMALANEEVQDTFRQKLVAKLADRPVKSVLLSAVTETGLIEVEMNLEGLESSLSNEFAQPVKTLA